MPSHHFLRQRKCRAQFNPLCRLALKALSAINSGPPFPCKEIVLTNGMPAKKPTQPALFLQIACQREKAYTASQHVWNTIKHITHTHKW